jgi:hypothetical protein
VQAPNQPGRLNFQPVILAPGRDEARLVINVPNNVPPGVHTLVLRGQALLQGGRNNRGRQNVVLVQPAAPIAVTIVPRNLAAVSVSPSRPQVTPGGQVEVEVRVASRYDSFAGDYKVRLVVDGKAGGIRAQEVTIPAGQDRARLRIEAGADARPGAQVDVVLRATTLVGKEPVTQETRLSVGVVAPETGKNRQKRGGK